MRRLLDGLVLVALRWFITMFDSDVMLCCSFKNPTLQRLLLEQRYVVGATLPI